MNKKKLWERYKQENFEKLPCAYCGKIKKIVIEREIDNEIIVYCEECWLND